MELTSSRRGYVVLVRYSQNGCTLLLEPTHRLKQPPKLRIVIGEYRQPFSDWFALPPRFLANRRKSIAIQSCSNVTWRRVREGIVGKQRQRATIVVQKFPDKMQGPRILGR